MQGGLVVGLQLNISELFHWHDLEFLGPDG
jgi:hypothetical protein